MLLGGRIFRVIFLFRTPSTGALTATLTCRQLLGRVFRRKRQGLVEEQGQKSRVPAYAVLEAIVTTTLPHAPSPPPLPVGIAQHKSIV
jgi:hypothetical protein